MRRKRLLIASELFARLFMSHSRHAYSVVDGLPRDARVCGVAFDGSQLSVAIESDGFEPVPEGQELPAIEIEAENLRHRAFPLTIGN